MTYNGTALHFSYDANGGPLSVLYNDDVFYYVLNLQGDVVAILDSAGIQVVTYTYDAWGKLLTTTGSMSSTLGLYNPLRYRSYIYDNETNLYYLQSRYYDPNRGRFINADVYISTGQGLLGNNMFAYCGNNPTMRIDATGAHYVSILDRITTDGCGGRGAVPKMITNQNDAGIGSRTLGITTVSHGGCGPVATYNALLTLGNEKTLDEVLRYYNESPGRTVAGGLLGTLPNQVASFFESEGYRVIMSSSPDGIEIFSQTADACILWYAFPVSFAGIDVFGAHFVHYRKSENGYMAYNVGLNGTETFQHPFDYGDWSSRYCPIGIFIYNYN